MSDEQPLLMTGQTRTTLQAKLRQPAEPLATYWQHLQLLARQNPFWFSSYNVLAFVVTGADAYRQHARDLFLRFTHAKDAGLLTKEVQFHTHTAAAPLGRLMALYDWVVDTDLLTPAEDAAFRAAALDFAAQVPMKQLQGRARMFDNQIFSNAFGAAVAGHVLGVRRGDSAQGRRIHAVGMEWLLDQFGRLPHSCYSGEGSTYHMLVVLPLLTLAGAFVEEVTGLPLYQRGVAPAFSPLRDWLILGRDLVGPAGLLPGWDAYGVFPSAVRSPLAYLARRDQDANALALIRDAQMWYRSAHISWEFDDRLWTLVWWPETLASAPVCPFHPWMNSSSAGAIQDGRTQTRLFQYWDQCGGGPFNGRSNVNPNAIDLQSAGLPVLLDGAPSMPVELLNLDEAAALRYLPAGVMRGFRNMFGLPDTAAGLSQALRHAISGSIGDSNSLVVDGENWYVPLKPAAGKGLALHDAGGLQVIESDAVDYYRDRYDVTRATRISALVDGRIVLCLDDWVAPTPHRLTWQAFTWPGAIQTNTGVQADIGRQLKLDLLAGPAGAWKLTPVPGFPKTPCNGSTRLEFQLPEPVATARLLIGMVIQDQLDAGEDLSRGWNLIACLENNFDSVPPGGPRSVVAAAMRQTDATERVPPVLKHALTANGQECTDVDLTTFYLTDALPSGSTLTFRRKFQAAAGSALFLRVPTATPALRVQVNGRDVPPAYTQINLEIQGSTSDFAYLFEIGPACQPGENELTLILNTFHGESLRGPVTLHRPAAPPPVALTAAGVNQWTVRIGDKNYQILLANDGLADWQAGQTDARHALYSASGELALAGVCRANFPKLGVQVKSNLPVDVSISGTVVRFGLLPANAHINVCLPGGSIMVSSRSVLLAACSVPGLTLAFRQEEARTGFLNGQAMGRRGGPGDRLVEWRVPTAAPAGDIQIRTADDIYRLADSFPVDLATRVEACLQSGDWRLQLAAAEVAGQFDLQRLVLALVQLLDDEAAKPAHPPLTRSWSESKMNIALEAGADKSLDPTIDPVEGTKRYRLAQALVTALGRLGDQRAVALLERIMTRGTDFFPALAQVPVALARLGSSSSIAVLQRHWDYGEINVRVHVRLALAFLNSEISRTEFESRVNPA